MFARAILPGIMLAFGLAQTDERSSGRAGSDPEVRWSGALKNLMMKGDFKGTIDLDAVSKLSHVYAVGALEDLQGEVTMIDGAASIVRVHQGKVTVSPVAKGKASVLVFAQVKQWRSVPLPAGTESLADLENVVVATAKKQGVNVSRPFPFLVKGNVQKAQYHVLHHPGALKDSSDLHAKAQTRFTLKDATVELVGFYSDRHLGIFTCGGNLHVHLRSTDGKTSGHLDEVVLGAGMEVCVPSVRAAGADPHHAGDAGKQGVKLQSLLKERLAVLGELVKVTESAYTTGHVSFERLLEAQRALLNAKLEACETEQERIAVLNQVVTFMKGYERTAEARYKTGNVTQADVLMARAARLDAEIALARANAKMAAKAK